MASQSETSTGKNRRDSARLGTFRGIMAAPRRRNLHFSSARRKGTSAFADDTDDDAQLCRIGLSELD